MDASLLFFELGQLLGFRIQCAPSAVLHRANGETGKVVWGVCVWKKEVPAHAQSYCGSLLLESGAFEKGLKIGQVTVGAVFSVFL